MGITERKWLAIPARAFTSDGSSEGVILLSSNLDFRVKQKAIIRSNTKPPLQVEIKRVNPDQSLEVGPVGDPAARTDITQYTLAANSTIETDEQPRSAGPLQELQHTVYEEEPVIAIRTIPVDPQGQHYTTLNPLPVQLNGEVHLDNLNVQLTAKDDDPSPGDVHDAVRIGDGTNEAKVNPDGSLNVVVQNSGGGLAAKNIYAEADAIASGVETTLVTYVVPAMTSAILEKVAVSGENIAKYRILVNGLAIETLRTYFGASLNALSDFTSMNGRGYTLQTGDVVTVSVLHGRLFVGDFSARLQVVES